MEEKLEKRIIIEEWGQTGKHWGFSIYSPKNNSIQPCFVSARADNWRYHFKQKFPLDWSEFAEPIYYNFPQAHKKLYTRAKAIAKRLCARNNISEENIEEKLYRTIP